MINKGIHGFSFSFWALSVYSLQSGDDHDDLKGNIAPSCYIFSCYAQAWDLSPEHFIKSNPNSMYFS